MNGLVARMDEMRSTQNVLNGEDHFKDLNLSRKETAPVTYPGSP
jgi:hypothetical protein